MANLRYEVGHRSHYEVPFRTFLNTSSIILDVSLPVFVFCRLG